MTLRHEALTDEEFDRLADFLEAIGPQAMNIESLDGSSPRAYLWAGDGDA